MKQDEATCSSRREGTRLITADQLFARVVRKDRDLSGHLQMLGGP